ncbi:uncharacterized protein LOC131604790 [Vicia villosa]|uniref:uncharacterized protein LOC131604790 n=1 Tax=Vicia villosa TaxID=3911 RepID=UPI00273BC9B5|nr:uncharacterized protein LOC131604790 [Vicia villosa]
MLLEYYPIEAPDILREKAFGYLWKINIPFRIKAFGWKCFWNRVATKDQLSRRGVDLISDLFCLHCGTVEESLDHLLGQCCMANSVWRKIANWVGIDGCVENHGWRNFLRWFEFFKRKKIKTGNEGIIWMAVCWSLWISTNIILFEEGICDINDIVWNIKLQAWKWSFIGDITYTKYNFYEFYKAPLDYLV